MHDCGVLLLHSEINFIRHRGGCRFHISCIFSPNLRRHFGMYFPIHSKGKIPKGIFIPIHSKGKIEQKAKICENHEKYTISKIWICLCDKNNPGIFHKRQQNINQSMQSMDEMETERPDYLLVVMAMLHRNGAIKEHLAAKTLCVPKGISLYRLMFFPSLSASLPCHPASCRKKRMWGNILKPSCSQAGVSEWQ